MSADPQNADGPDTREDMAWEVRHCATRLDYLAEFAWEALPRIDRSRVDSRLREAAVFARRAASLLEGEARW